MMAKSQKDLAYLRDLFISEQWTDRFTDLVDKHLDLSDAENLLYINSGTGSHAMGLEEKFGEKTAIFAMCEDDAVLSIARDKAIALGSRVDFSTMRFEDDSFDAVLADASFVASGDVSEFIDDVVSKARSGGDVAIFLPSAGSFGEVYSLLWEVCFNDGLSDQTERIEKMIADIPSASRIKEIGEFAGLVNVRTQTAPEFFEYESGEEFMSSPLVADYLLPMWLDFLEDENEKERVSRDLAQLIDAEDGTMPFRFGVKMTLLTGEKG